MAEHDWENFFQSLIQVLDEAENVTTEQQREITGLHLEDGVSALQQVISLVPGESESGQVLATLLRNFRLLLASWRNVSSDRCSNVAIYSLDAPPMVQSVNAVTWGFVIHGAIDGFSRCIVYLECSTNNRSDTVTELFSGATRNFGWPSRVRTDKGGENVGIWAMMEEFRGANRRSYIAGSSVHNQRIERLWRDVFCMVCHLFYYTFQAMEESGVLNIGDEIHKFILHFVFLPRINIALNSFVASWNNHPMRTARNWSPYRIWVNGVLDIPNHENVGVSDIVDSSSGEVEWYGYDPRAPAPNDDGLSSVEVLDADPNLPDHILEQLRAEIDPCENSNNFGIDIYLRALNIVVSAN
eukprot:Seg6868.1 transcript_id=Seg6868.1/GoldUCD/mRNA.D3Y31 product="hypothetical protein" protein_id=Seg6868.1/GoldUCD/D3Y31